MMNRWVVPSVLFCMMHSFKGRPPSQGGLFPFHDAEFRERRYYWPLASFDR
jgi:hypothetical protein